MPVISTSRQQGKSFNQFVKYAYLAFPHLMRHVQEIIVQENIRYLGRSIVLRYSQNCAEVIRVEHQALELESYPFGAAIHVMQKYENTRRPKHARELHKQPGWFVTNK